jgi:hypothetical protein
MWAEFDPGGKEQLPHRNLSGTAQGVYAHPSKLCFSAIPASDDGLLSPSRVGIPEIGQLTGGESDSSAKSTYSGNIFCDPAVRHW